MLKIKELFEIPIYRLTEDKYYTGLRNYLKSNKTKHLDDEYFRNQYGGDWQYNEIVGYFRFYKYGANQIRCYFWDTDAKRKVKTKRKHFIQKSDSYCEAIFDSTSSNEKLITILNECIDHCANRIPKGRYVDRRLFDSTCKFTNWQGVLA